MVIAADEGARDSPCMSFSSFVALLAAFGLGSVFTALIASAREKRVARGRVLRAISELEELRWYRPNHRHASEAAGAVRAEALVAKVPRTIVELYTSLALGAAKASENDWAKSENPDDFFAGAISFKLSMLTRDAAQLMVDTVWRPARSWRGRGQALRQLEERREGLEDDDRRWTDLGRYRVA